MFRRIPKLRYKLILIVLVLLSVPLLVVTGITHNRSLKVIRNQSMLLNTKLVETGAQRIEASFGQMSGIYQSVYLNESFRSYLRQQSQDPDYADTPAYPALMKSVFLSILSSRSDIYSIIYIDGAGRLTYSTRDEAGHADDYRSMGLPEEFRSLYDGLSRWGTGMRVIPTARHMPLRRKAPGTESYVYAVARRIVNIEGQYETIGVLFITLDLSDMRDLTQLIRPYDDSLTYISDSQGRIIYDSSGELTGLSLPDRLRGHLRSAAGNALHVSVEEDYVTVSALSESTGWRIINVIPESVYEADAFSVSTSIVVTTLLALIVSAVIIAFASRLISRPIEQLAGTMNRMEIGHLNERVEVVGSDEIAYLGRSFNNLMEKLEDAIYNEYVMEIRQKTAVIRALQAQLNPHFLYNVLQSISSMALVHNIPEINTMAKALGSILRYSIKAQNTTATVREEIEHVRNYLAIQKIRFGDRLSYVIDVPEYIMGCELPRVSLQPMVENAVIHGFEPMQRPGNILITGWIEEWELYLEVSDDGCGIPREELDQLTRELESGEDVYAAGSSGLGIRNLSARLRLFYNGRGTLGIASEPGVGTSILIRIPIEKGG